MDRKQFEKFLNDLQKNIKYDSCNPGKLLSGTLEEYNLDYNNYEEAEDKIRYQDRWSVSKKKTYKICDKYFVSFLWDNPATEYHEGNATNMEIFESKQRKVVKYEYDLIN